MLQLRYLVAGFLMVAAAGATTLLIPTEKLSDTVARTPLEDAIPARFGDWQIDPSIVPLLANPELQASVARAYNQTLSRTYINGQGERVMLSIAYGDDQRGETQAHRPESCYPGQGFELLSNNSGLLNTPFGNIPVRRLETRAVSRWEPVTYWMTIGDQAATSTLERRLAMLNYTSQGVIPDGLLFRVSSIERESTKAFRAQSVFVNQLLETLDPVTRRRIAGIGEK
jgi:EpsI family protein